MKNLLKYILLFSIATIYMVHRVEVHSNIVDINQYGQFADENSNSHSGNLVLSSINSEALPVNTVNQVINVLPGFRYLQKNMNSIVKEEHEREFTSYIKYINNFYISSFAHRQNTGYYIFALCEILV